MPKKTNCKEVIINAAEEVVLESGAVHMSLDIVAKKAGVSKGGLMYHFPTKEALLKEMVARMVLQFYQDREEKLREIKEGPGQLLKAGILAQMEYSHKKTRIGSSILAAAAHQPKLLEPVQQAYRNHLAELEKSGVKFERAAILSLAADGLMLIEMLAFSPYTDAQRKKIREEMLRMIADEGK